jgi:hypothetical protein
MCSELFVDLLFIKVSANMQYNTFYPIEFKKTATPSINVAKNFLVLKKFDKIIGPGAVICLREDAIPLSQEVVAIPIGWL